MNKLFIPIFIGIVSISALNSNAQSFSLRPHASIGLGKAVDIQSVLPLDYDKSHSNEFGLDFGYAFFEKNGNSISANIGIGYRMTDFNLSCKEFSYEYEAPAYADMDDNTYIRCLYSISDFSQKMSASYLAIPVYFGYSYLITDWLDIYANIGVNFDIKCSASLKKIGGVVGSYGIYPEYGDLIIDESYLNGFGQSSLVNAAKKMVSANSLVCSMLLGFGLDARIYGPLWFNIGIRYNYGFGDMFKGITQAGEDFTAQTAPVSYTVADGETVRPLSDFMTKSRLSNLALNLGLTFKF